MSNKTVAFTWYIEVSKFRCILSSLLTLDLYFYYTNVCKNKLRPVYIYMFYKYILTFDNQFYIFICQQLINPSVTYKLYFVLLYILNIQRILFVLNFKILYLKTYYCNNVILFVIFYSLKNFSAIVNLMKI